MRLLLVHGRSQGGKDPVRLKADWIGALDRGLQKAGLSLPAAVDIDFPFYGDRLDEFVRQFELPADPAIVPKGSPVFDEFAEFRKVGPCELPCSKHCKRLLCRVNVPRRPRYQASTCRPQWHL
jgi:hypothetical protein